MESKALAKRTPLRLQHFDYSQSGCYFVTVCIKDRKPILCKILPNPRVGTDEDSSETDRAQMTLSRTIRQFKTFTTKQARQIVGNQELLLWQSRFYDHIIRNDEDYAEKWQYIDENPLKYIYFK